MSNILFCVCALGLGHVTRTLPLIKHYLNNGENKVYVTSEPNVLGFLKNEFKNTKNLVLIEKENKYPPLERGKSNLAYTAHIILDGLSMPSIVKKENKVINKIVSKYKINFIISDGIYGAYSRKVPCFLLTHQLEFKFYGIPFLFRPLTTIYNKHIFNKFTKVFVLDYKKEISIAGKLAPEKYKKNNKLEYVGILSQYNKTNIKEDIDYLVIISGYLLEYKQEFYEKILGILKTRKGKKVFILGDYINDYHKKLPGDVEVYSSFKNLDKNKLYNQAKIIISRTGYSTVMDLIELNKDAILIPTPNESEQMYLGDYHTNKGYFNIIQSQKEINKDNLKHNTENTKLIKKSNLPKTKETIKKITNIINEYTIK